MRTRRELLEGVTAAAVMSTLSERPADAASDFPPVSVLQDRLPLHPGDRLPKLIPWRGRLLQPVFVRATKGAGGRYTVELELV